MRTLDRRVLGALTVAVLLTLGVGCDGGPRPVDVRFSTPERTVQTLFTAYGLERASQAEVRQRMIDGGRFSLRDPDSYRACFTDLSGPTEEGLAGFVLGALAAGKDELRTSVSGDRAVVSPREGVEIVLRRRDEESPWRIVLRESVPDEVRARMNAVALDYEHRQARGQRISEALR